MPRRIKYFGGKEQTLPIKDKKLLKRVLDYLQFEMTRHKTKTRRYQAYRNYMLFLIGINTAFRAEDLLQLRVKDVEKGYMHIKENKTGKMQNFPLNKNLHSDIMKYIETYKLESNDYLFMGQQKVATYKGVTKKVIYPITRQTGDYIMTNIEKACGINFTFGMHSLRKTFAYQYYMNGGNLITLMKMLNHSSPEVTLLYIMLDSQEIEDARSKIYIGGK